jgi:HEAT repeat protein
MLTPLAGSTIALAVVLFLPNLGDASDLRESSVLVASAQVSFEQAIGDLTSTDPATRLRAVQMLKATPYPEAAVPLAALVTDPQDDIQLEAITAELNIFLLEPVVSRRRVGLVIEVRKAVVAESAFSSGPLAVGARPVPIEVLSALRLAARDDNPRVAREALYAFGVLASDPSGALRRELLHGSGPELAALTGASDPVLRCAAVRVLGRVFAKRAQDAPIEEPVGDAVITALNDTDRAVKAAAMQALGSMRYERGIQALTALYQYYGTNIAADAALDALARIGHPSSAPVFAEELAGKNAARRGIAIEGFARIGDATKLDAIERALVNERSEGAVLAGVFASALLANGPITRIADAITKARLRDQSLQYLIELAPGRASGFRAHLQDPDAHIRLDLVDVLGLAGDAAAIPIIEPLLTDRDPQVADAAERAIARIKASSRGGR